MGGSSPPPQTTSSTKVELGPEQKELFGLAMPGLRDFATSPPPQRYPGSQIAPLNYDQQVAQAMQRNTAYQQNATAGAGNAALNKFFEGDFWNPGSNPVLQSAMDATARPVMQNLTEVALPAIRSDAIASGNFSNSGRQIGEGIATRGAMQAIADSGAKLAQSTYDTNVNAILKALGLMPQTMQAQYMGAEKLGQVGDAQRAYDQSLLDEKVGNFTYDQLAPFLQSKELLSLISGMPGATTIGTQTGAMPQTNKAQSALGGAASGAALGSAIMPGIGTAAGAGIGALLPFLLK